MGAGSGDGTSESLVYTEVVQSSKLLLQLLLIDPKVYALDCTYTVVHIGPTEVRFTSCILDMNHASTGILVLQYRVHVHSFGVLSMVTRGHPVHTTEKRGLCLGGYDTLKWYTMTLS